MLKVYISQGAPPDLAGEDAGEQHVVGGFRGLAAESANVGILQAMSFPTVCGPEPSPSVNGKPEEKFHLGQRTGSPKLLGSQHGGPTDEQGAVCQGGGVFPGRGPLLDEAIRRSRLEDDVFQSLPKGSILVEHSHGGRTRDVADPSAL